MAARVLTLADDPRIPERVREGLVGESFLLHASPTRDGLAAAVRVAPDLVVLDLPPIPGGWHLLHRLRAWSDVPVVLLVTDEAIDARIEALERGADDCLGRSFDPAELRARVRAVLRRSLKTAPEPARVGELWLDPAASDAHLSGRRLGLRPHEFALLLVLARNPGVVLSRQRLVQLTRGSRARPARPESLDVYVSRLRRKLAGTGVVIQAVRGVGYKLVLRADPSS